MVTSRKRNPDKELIKVKTWVYLRPVQSYKIYAISTRITKGDYIVLWAKVFANVTNVALSETTRLQMLDDGEGTESFFFLTSLHSVKPFPRLIIRERD